MPPLEVIPSAKRLMMSLRDMGYDFAQAVADVVDNSIEAHATHVAIDLQFVGDDSWVRIADNGRGMKPEQLREAMRYGSDRDYDPEDLGKFGLGLKTASMSQCQVLSVASRWNPERADIAAYSWDLDHIVRTNKWEILPLEREGLTPALRTPLQERRGTVVLWSKLDRILGFKHPYGEFARKRLVQMCREIEVHLGMVFHRFLNGEVSRKKLRISVNGNDVVPWDPFCREETKTTPLQEIRFEVEHEGTVGEVLLQPFILPHQSDFSSQEAFRLASGPANWNQQQGFYIYRAGRMIQSGGWSNLRAPDEHNKLARIAVSFSPVLDDAFKINVAKMRVQLPSSIREQVRIAIVPIAKLAREIYDKKEGKPQTPKTTDANGSRPPAGDSGSRPPTSGAKNQAAYDPLLSLDEWSTQVLAVANRAERTVIERVLRKMKSARHNASPSRS
jgi:hypothetical protein